MAASEIRGNDAVSVEVIRQPNDDLVSRHLAFEHLLRLPTNAELDAGASALEAFIDLFPRAQFVAVGRVAAAQLPSAGRVWHPASGGGAFFAGRSRRFCRAFDSV